MYFQRMADVPCIPDSHGSTQTRCCVCTGWVLCVHVCKIWAFEPWDTRNIFPWLSFEVCIGLCLLHI